MATLSKVSVQTEWDFFLKLHFIDFDMSDKYQIKIIYILKLNSLQATQNPDLAFALLSDVIRIDLLGQCLYIENYRYNIQSRNIEHCLLLWGFEMGCDNCRIVFYYFIR